MTAISTAPTQQPPPLHHQSMQHQQPTESSSKSSSTRSGHLLPQTPPLRASSHARLDELRAATLGNAADMTLRSDANGSLTSAATTNGGEVSRFRAQLGSSPDRDSNSNGASDKRPSSAPGRKNGFVATGIRDDHGIDEERPRRPVKPSLQRSKSDYAPRQTSDTDSEDEIRQEWGARHGFEDHYQSEHIISQLANVS